MDSVQCISAQIEADKHNIQEMINLIPLCTTKGEERTLKAVIKNLVKEIHTQKCLIDEKLFLSNPKLHIPLFEVTPSPLEAIEIYKEMDSFFGDLS